MTDRVTASARQNDGSVRFETRTTRVKSDGYEREGYPEKTGPSDGENHRLDARLSDLSSGVETRQTH